MSTRPTYCRRTITKHGREDVCGNRIVKVNPLDWCEDCRARLPFWPTSDEAAQ